MLRFVVRRLLLLVPILIGLSILVFLWIRALPGSPAQALLGERSTPAAEAAIRKQYGLDDPIHEQYFAYVGKVVRFDFGDSIVSRRGRAPPPPPRTAPPHPQSNAPTLDSS